MARVLNTTVMVGDTIYPAGTPESEIDGEVTADVWDGEAAGGRYVDLKVDELKAEIAKRNEGRDDADLISDEGKKADLVAALELDDEDA